MSPTQQKSANNSSGITSQIQDYSSSSLDEAKSSDNEEEKAQRPANADVTQEINCSLRASQINNEPDHNEVRIFNNFMQRQEVAGSSHREECSDKSFVDEHDSVGEEFSVLLSAEKIVSSCQNSSIKPDFLQDGGVNRQETLPGSARVERRSLDAREQTEKARQKVHVRGSVVRNNFQQSLQAINLPLRNQTSVPALMDRLASEKTLSQVPRLGNRVPRPPIKVNCSKRNERHPHAQRTCAQNEKRDVNVDGRHEEQNQKGRQTRKLDQHLLKTQFLDLKSLLGGAELNQDSASRQNYQEKRPMSATQSVSDRFKSDALVKKFLNKTKETVNQCSIRESKDSTVALGPKILAHHALLVSSQQSHQIESFVLHQSSSSDEGLPQVFDCTAEPELFRERKRPFSFNAGVSENTLVEKKPLLNRRPKQPVVSDHLSSEEDLFEDLNARNKEDSSQSHSLSNQDASASHNICVSKISRTMKTLQSSAVLLGALHQNLLRKTQIGQEAGSENQQQSKILGSSNDSKPATRNRKYFLDQNTQLTDLKMPRMNLKFVSINLFSKNLVNIDLTENKIQSLPEEVASISTLQVLKVDQNLLSCLPKDLWKLKKLRKLIASGNQLQELPPNFEWIQSLEVLQINDNLIRKLPEKLGLLSCLQKLHLHENKLASLPRDLCKLVNLTDFSLEWFMYSKPAQARIQKSPEAIKSVRDFCQNFHFNPGQTRIGGITSLHGQRPLQHSFLADSNTNATDYLQRGSDSKSKYVTFCDFIIQQYKIAHSDLAQINKIEFTMKKRSLVHQVCFNVHTHLLESLLNLPAQTDVSDTHQQKHPNAHSLQEPFNAGDQLCLDRAVDCQLSENPVHAETSQAAIAKVISLHKKDTQGIVPLCLLVMNMTPIERSHNVRDETVKTTTEQDARAVESRAAELGKSASNYFSQDYGLPRAKQLNKNRRAMMRMLLEFRDEAGETVVDINNSTKRAHNPTKSNASTILVTQGHRNQQQQHPVLYWTVFKYQFKLAIELIEKFGADPTVLNQNGANLLHILFANFNHDLKYAGQLASLLLARKVNLNLIDKDGKSPVLVAIKKSQIEALKFAHEFNIQRQVTLMGDPSYTQASQLIKRSICKLELFDFRMSGRSKSSVLHYVIKKSNYEAFMYLVQHQLSDCFARDCSLLTPRLSALINSAFYRILLNEEKWSVLRHIAQMECSLIERVKQPVEAQGSLLCYQLSKPAVLLEYDGGRDYPPMKVSAMDGKEVFDLMKKPAIEQPCVSASIAGGSLNNIRSSRALDSFAQVASQVKVSEQKKTHMVHTVKHRSSKAFRFQNMATEEITSSVGSPKMAVFRAPAIPQFTLGMMTQLTVLSESPKGNPTQTNELTAINKVATLDTGAKVVSQICSTRHQREALREPDFIVKSLRAQLQFVRANLVSHCVFSRRQIIERQSVRNSDHLKRENWVPSVLPQQKSKAQGSCQQSAPQMKQEQDRAFAKETVAGLPTQSLRTVATHNDFNVARGQQNVSAANSSQRLRVKPQSQNNHSRERDCSGRDSAVLMKVSKSTTEFQSPTQVPPTETPRSRIAQAPETEPVFVNNEDLVTTRLINIDTFRLHDLKQVQAGITKQPTARPETLSSKSVFCRSTGTSQQLHRAGFMSHHNQSLQLRQEDAQRPTRLNELHPLEMKPLTLKRPKMESPDKILWRQDSDLSAPPSFRQANESNRLRQVKQTVKMHQAKRIPLQIELPVDDELGKALQPRQDNDEVIQQASPTKTADCSPGVMNNLFGFGGLVAEEQFNTVRVIEGPYRPIHDMQLYQRDEPAGQHLEDMKIITSPHFNQELYEFQNEEDVSVQSFLVEQTGEGGSYSDAPSNSQFYQQQSCMLKQQGKPDQSKSRVQENEQLLGPRPPQASRNARQVQAANRTQQSEKDWDAFDAPDSSGRSAQNNIFISNMNININLNINISVPQQEHDIILSSQTSDAERSVVGLGSSRWQASQEQPHLSTILDEEQLNEEDHRPKPSLGSKNPLSQQSRANPTTCKKDKSAWGSLLESQAKQITQQSILDQINPIEIAQAVSMHFQNKKQKMSLSGSDEEFRLNAGSATRTKSWQFGSPLDEQRMFSSKSPQTQNVPIEKKFQLNQAFLNNHSQKSRSGLKEGHSENLETSVVGTTPAKPQFAYNNRSGKNWFDQIGEDGVESHHQPYSAKRSQTNRNSTLRQQNLFKTPLDNDQKTVSESKVNQDPFGLQTNTVVESDEMMLHSQIFGYMLTDNTKAQLQKRGELEVDQPCENLAVLSASFDGMLKSSVSQRGYTAGNNHHGEHQQTLQSLTQASHMVLHTGISDIGCQSPINVPLKNGNRSNSPPVERVSLIASASLSQTRKTSLPQLPIPNELVLSCEVQLANNKFLKEFKTLSDPGQAMWLKYQTLYESLAPQIVVNSQAHLGAPNERRDALVCMELLVQVFTEQPCGILGDLIHIMTKNNLMKARNDLIDSVCATVTEKRKQESETELLVFDNEKSPGEQQNVSKRRTQAIRSTCSFSSAFVEAVNAKSINETYKKIQLNKFPTISKNLGLFLRKKRLNEKSNAAIPPKDESQSTQNVPQSLSKRVKISLQNQTHAIKQTFDDGQQQKAPLTEQYCDQDNTSRPSPREQGFSQRLASLQTNSPEQCALLSPSTRLVNQMKHLNAVSAANRPGFHSKLQTRLAEVVGSHGSIRLPTNSSTVQQVAINEERPSLQAEREASHSASFGPEAIHFSNEKPSKIQPIRNILSPKGFFPSAK